MKDNTTRRFRSLSDQDGRRVQQVLGQLNVATSDDGARGEGRGGLTPEPSRSPRLRPLTDEFRPADPPRRKEP